MENKKRNTEENTFRRTFGIHLTSSKIFTEFIFPEIQDKLWQYKWIDLYAGEGNLIIPILNSIPLNDRIKFFNHHIWLHLDLKLRPV